jgi:hypothetical protein
MGTIENQSSRYAVFFVPSANSDLYRFGSSVLGYDCYTGAEVDRPAELRTNPRRWHNATDEPRRYGFHALLKAPFHLLPSCTEAQLVSAIESFAGLGYVAPTMVPTLRFINGFAAIVPLKAEPSLAALATACSTIFDAYRAPISPQERARRIAARSSESQAQNLAHWGDSYVNSDFQFHLKLTGQIQANQRRETLALLQKCFDRMCDDRPIPIDRIALAKQTSAQASFRIVSHPTPKAVS